MMMSHLFPLHAQAVFLAARIEAYWHSLGHENVKAWPIEERVTKTGIAWGIRSNLYKRTAHSWGEYRERK